MKKWLLKIAILLTVIITPVVTLFFVTENTPNQYNNTYLAELNDKYMRLNEDDKKKIVFIGDSAMPFSLRSDLIEEQLPDYKVVNFGLYGALGTKLMLDLSKSNIQKGDIYIISPGVSQQTYSLYFNPEVTLQACDGFSFKYSNLGWDDNWDLVYHYYDFMKDKLSYSINGNAPDPIGIYRHDSFNEYGDIKVDRPNNIMNNGYDSSTMITIKDELLDANFIEYVNKYCEYVRSKGAKVYFNFSPCNELAVQSSRKTRDAFQEKLDNALACDLLSNLEDCIIDYRYFYDTNYHLNSSGAIYYTSILTKNLKMKLGTYVPSGSGDSEEDEGSGDIIIPTPPEREEEPVEPVEPEENGIDFDKYTGEANNDFVNYFNYRLVGSSYQITGVKNEYFDMENVILPTIYEGKSVTTIVENAFYGCINLKNIYIGKTYRSFEEKSFNGCINLQGIYLYALDGNTLNPPSKGLLDGANKSVRIYIPEGANYASGYTWLNYRSYFTYFEPGVSK